MASFNKVILLGYVAHDPELKKTLNGLSVCTVSIGVTRSFADQNGERKSDFFNVTFWRQHAEVVVKHFKKGNSILVCGHLEVRSWNDNQGNKRYSTDIIAEEFSFVTPSNIKSDGVPFPEARSNSKSNSGSPYPVPSFNSAEQVWFEEIPDDGHLPF